MTERWKYIGGYPIRLGTMPLEDSQEFDASEALSRELEKMPELFEKVKKPKKAKKKKGGEN